MLLEPVGWAPDCQSGIKRDRYPSRAPFDRADPNEGRIDLMDFPIAISKERHPIRTYVDVAKGIGSRLQNGSRWFDSNHRLHDD